MKIQSSKPLEMKSIAKIFKALSSETRLKIVKILNKGEFSITDISKKLNISKVSVLKHVKILEDAGIIDRIKIGREFKLRLNKRNLYKILNIFGFRYKVRVESGRTVLDVLLKVSKDIKVRRYNDSIFVYSIDFEDGNFIYEIDGELPDVPMNKFRIYKNVKIVIKKLVPIVFKEIVVNLK